MPKRPVISGKKLVKALTKLGYEVVRQRGSHITLHRLRESEKHMITIPLHKELAKGTLSDIRSKIALWNRLSKEDLYKLME